MNVTLYAWAEVSSLRPGSIILDIEAEPPDGSPEVMKLPVAYVVDETSDRLDGRTVYARPLGRKDGKRRVWRFLNGEQVCVEPDPEVGGGLLDAIMDTARGLSCSAVLAPGGRALSGIIWEGTVDDD